MTVSACFTYRYLATLTYLAERDIHALPIVEVSSCLISVSDRDPAARAERTYVPTLYRETTTDCRKLLTYKSFVVLPLPESGYLLRALRTIDAFRMASIRAAQRAAFCVF